MRLRFLGTGASGGTPGSGRSRRAESSLLVEDGGALLLDVTRDFAAQARVRGVGRIDAVLLTHAHRDASGGIAQLRGWWRARRPNVPPVPLYAHAATIAALRRRFARLDHVEPIAVADGRPLAIGGWAVEAIEVPHARDCPTFAWRLSAGGVVLVYASDLARLTPALEAACRGATVLVVDGAMWGRPLFSHLRIDRALPELCRWPVEHIVLTQIGRTAPPHARLAREVAIRCPRARPAYDGMTLAVAPGQPLTTPSGTSRATRAARPARSTTPTTRSTSL